MISNSYGTTAEYTIPQTQYILINSVDLQRLWKIGKGFQKNGEIIPSSHNLLKLKYTYNKSDIKGGKEDPS